jgi:hypothetical protein
MMSLITDKAPIETEEYSRKKKMKPAGIKRPNLK